MLEILQLFIKPLKEYIFKNNKIFTTVINIKLLYVNFLLFYCLISKITLAESVVYKLKNVD